MAVIIILWLRLSFFFFEIALFYRKEKQIASYPFAENEELGHTFLSSLNAYLFIVFKLINQNDINFSFVSKYASNSFNQYCQNLFMFSYVWLFLVSNWAVVSKFYDDDDDDDITFTINIYAAIFNDFVGFVVKYFGTKKKLLRRLENRTICKSNQMATKINLTRILSVRLTHLQLTNFCCCCFYW